MRLETENILKNYSAILKEVTEKTKNEADRLCDSIGSMFDSLNEGFGKSVNDMCDRNQ